MNTFLPYPDFARSAACLDNKRLGKQRVEAIQLIHGQWSNHPASKMWSMHIQALKAYFNAVSSEWIARGFRHTMGLYLPSPYILPPWFGDDKFHSLHRANLIRKDSAFYRKFGWTESPVEGYIWPTPCLT